MTTDRDRPLAPTVADSGASTAIAILNEVIESLRADVDRYRKRAELAAGLALCGWMIVAGVLIVGVIALAT